MPCPFFEPQRVVRQPDYSGGRLPLLAEYDGLCHAAVQTFRAPEELRLRCCNHGYSRGSCPHFPLAETRSCARFNVVKAAGETLDILYVEERDYAPVRWQSIRFSWQSAVLDAESLDPEIEDACTRAQAVAFCRSYRRQFCRPVAQALA